MSSRPISGRIIKYRLLVVGFWIVVPLLLVPTVPQFLKQLGGVTFNVSGSPTQHTQQLLQRRFPSLSTEQDLVVIHSDRLTAQDPAFRATVKRSMAALSGKPHITSLISPYGPRSDLQTSVDGHTALIIVNMQGADRQLQKEVPNLQQTLLSAGRDGVQTYLTGTSPLNATANKQEVSDIAKADEIGLPVAFIVLLLAFGSLVAAELPLLLAALGIIISFGILAGLSKFITFDVFEESAVTMVGLALGIDYSLMIVTRFREELDAGHASFDATVRTMQTAGRAVLFSGLTVIAGDTGLLFVRTSFFKNLALGLMITVAVMLALCLTLLPAILGTLGRRINALTVFKVTASTKNAEQGFWSHWARAVMRRPVTMAAIAVFALLLVALPARSMHLGFNLGTGALGSQPAAQGLTFAERAFTPGVTSPIQVVISRDNGSFTTTDLTAIATLQQQIARNAHVQVTLSLPQTLQTLTGRRDATALALAAQQTGSLSEQLNVGHGSNVTVLTVIPKVAPDSKEALQLLGDVRRLATATTSADTALHAGFTGITAEINSLSQETARAIPVVLAFVLSLSILILFVTFRSIALPLKAVAMNLLALGATFGIITFVFQSGFGSSLLAFTPSGYIQDYLPLLTFVILFGLSMDYEVFLLSRIQEEWRKTGDNVAAVAYGIEHTAKVISYAAAIMVVVFLSFVTTHILEIKQLGFALAAAVLIDATVIRLLLVPAIMRLFGPRNWWAPRWLSYCRPPET